MEIVDYFVKRAGDIGSSLSELVGGEEQAGRLSQFIENRTQLQRAESLTAHTMAKTEMSRKLMVCRLVCGL